MATKKAPTRDSSRTKQGGKAPNTVAKPKPAARVQGARVALPVIPQNTKPAVERVEHGKFAPGVSGNPGGRPRKTPVYDALSALLNEVCPEDKKGRTYAQLLALAQVQKAIKGSIEHAREVVDRTEGKVKTRLEHSGPGGSAIAFNDLSHMTPEQRDAELNSVAVKLGFVVGGQQ